MDYFNVKPGHGSSPTASLAADLSQNFRINEARLVPPFPGLCRTGRAPAELTPASCMQPADGNTPPCSLHQEHARVDGDAR